LAMYAGDIMTVSISFLLTRFLSHTSDYMWTRQIVLSWGLDLCYWTSTPLNSSLIQTWVALELLIYALDNRHWMYTIHELSSLIINCRVVILY
jgi:hypothetical protein